MGEGRVLAEAVAIKMSLQLVPVTEQHAEGLRAVLDSVAREKRYLILLEAPPLEEMRRHITEGAAADAPHVVAIVDEELVGWCDVWRKPRPTLRHCGVLGMGVRSDHRGRGIGTALMGATLKAAREKDFKRIELTVRSDNPRAKKLYESFGFIEEGLCRRHMCIDGNYADSYLMAMFFD
jgi:RimJ/RimL family protein N-acetyltransferase